VLHFPFPQLNWLKYAPTVTSQGRLYEYSQTALPSLTPTKEAPAAPLPGARPLTTQEKADGIIKRLSKYNTLVRQLDDAYAADYMDERPTTKDGYVKQVQDQELFPPLSPGGLAAPAPSPPSVIAWRFANLPQQVKKDADDLLTEEQAALVGAKKVAADAATRYKKDPSPANKKAQNEAERDAKAAQTSLDGLTGALKPLQDALAPYLAADQAKRLEALGQLLALLLDPNPLRPPGATVLLPDEKDLAEVTVEYKLRPGYLQPAAVPTLAKEEFSVLLLPRFRITASVGIYTTGLVDHRFAFVRDSTQTGTKIVNGDTISVFGARQRIVRDNSEEKYSLLGAAAFGHFEYHLRPNLGLGLTLGAGVQNDGPRILLGPSVLLGNSQRLIISGGFAGGRVTRLATGYSEGQLLQNPTSSQVPTRTLNTGSWFFSLSYNMSSTLK
jgi:hypothetical protein